MVKSGLACPVCKEDEPKAVYCSGLAVYCKADIMLLYITYCTVVTQRGSQVLVLEMNTDDVILIELYACSNSSGAICNQSGMLSNRKINNSSQ